MKVSAALLVGVLLAGIAPWPSVSAAATAEPAFPPADLQSAERAPDLATWIYESLSLPAPDLSSALWENRSADRLLDQGMAIASTFYWENELGYQRLDYTSDGFLRGGWIDIDSAIRAADDTEGSLRSAALEIAARLGLPAEGLRATVSNEGRPYVTLDGSLPWGTPVHAQTFFIRFDGANISADRLVFAPWFTGAGEPTVSASAAQQSAMSAATARGSGAALTVRGVGATVTSGTHAAWVVTITEGNCSSETSYYYIDAETGHYLGRRGGVIADALCGGVLRLTILGGIIVVGAVAAVAVVVVWRRRKRAKNSDDPLEDKPV